MVRPGKIALHFRLQVDAPGVRPYTGNQRIKLKGNFTLKDYSVTNKKNQQLAHNKC